MTTRDLMSLDHLRSSEASTRLVTREKLRGIHDNVPQAIDCLFKINYFRGQTEPVTTDLGAFQSYAASSYITIPYTCASIYDLLLPMARKRVYSMVKGLWSVASSVTVCPGQGPCRCAGTTMSTSRWPCFRTHSRAVRRLRAEVSVSTRLASDVGQEGRDTESDESRPARPFCEHDTPVVAEGVSWLRGRFSGSAARLH